MSISFHCQGCGKRYSVKEDLAGKRVKCSACGAASVVPAASEKSREAEAAPAKPQRASAASSAPARASSSADEYELDPNSAPATTRPDSPTLTAGHRIQPKVDADDELELEPPLEPKVETAFFLDEDDAGSPDAGSPRPAAPRKTLPRVAAGTDEDAWKAAENLVVADDSDEKPGPPEPTTPCPSCNAPMKQGAVLCVACGFNVRTGEKIEGAANRKGGALGKIFGAIRREKG